MKPFQGEGTALRTETRGASAYFDRLDALDALKQLRALQLLLTTTIEAGGGNILSAAGGSQLAFWAANGHAQSAFDAAVEISRQVAQSEFSAVPIQVFLGTGELGGDFMGPLRQFPIAGKAMAVLDRLAKMKAEPGSHIRLSQHTARAVVSARPLSAIGTIERGESEPLEVYVCSTA
ncbi:MAG TPA: hypothetical protein VN915_09070 [Elusimicrobiota bacterium]|nr:hypothetical protein [Elusimicrobiota bacterium]